MNWKSTALLSGVTLMATWMAAAPQVRQPLSSAPSAPPAATPSADAATDIVREADRLRARLQAVAEYHQPSRNPFRFDARAPEARSSRSVDYVPPAPAVDATPAVPSGPQMSLSGIAEDASTGQMIRTAIISTPQDLLLVKEGDTIGGEFTVARIVSDAVELTRISDNSVVRLPLRP